MFKQMLSGGGDPEDKGFFRSLDGSHHFSQLSNASEITVDCGFVPEMVAGVYVNNASTINGVFQSFASPYGGFGAGQTLNQPVRKPPVINGTIITFYPNTSTSNWNNVTIQYRIVGRIEP